MKLQITSASGNILTTERFEKISLMTEAGEITILPGHEPLLSALRPGILHAAYFVGNKIHTTDYATGGGVVNISPDACIIVADMVESEDKLSDVQYIESQKKEAEALVKAYREENGAVIDPKKLIELEYELLKYTAMHRLGQKFHDTSTGTRK
jgi:F-type H+-transporting ATPase subunit epsilon